MFWRRKQRNLFPDEAKGVIYEEKMASGRSHKNWYSKLGGAKNCLRLVITDTELWITQFDGKVIEEAGMLKMDFLGRDAISSSSPSPLRSKWP